jgi:hypothetical protein
LLAETGHNGSSLSDKITQRSKKEIAGWGRDCMGEMTHKYINVQAIFQIKRYQNRHF